MEFKYPLPNMLCQMTECAVIFPRLSLPGQSSFFSVFKD